MRPYAATRLAAAATLLLSLSVPATAFEFHAFNDPTCGSGGESHTLHQIYGPDQGCHQTGAAPQSAGSVSIKNTGAIDDDFVVAIYSSPDCNPDTVIEFVDEGCMVGKVYQSIMVWDICIDDAGKKTPNCWAK